MKTRSPKLPPNPLQPSRETGGWTRILILLFHGAIGLVGMGILGKTLPVNKSEKAPYIVPGSNRSGVSMKMLKVDEMRKMVRNLPTAFFRSRLNCPPSQQVPTPPELHPIDSMEPLTGFIAGPSEGDSVAKNFRGNDLELKKRCLQWLQSFPPAAVSVFLSW